VLQNPNLVLPNEFGPADVGVSVPTFFIRILHSGGISSGSSSSSSLKIAATLADFCTKGVVGTGSEGFGAGGGANFIDIPTAAPPPELEILS
jgi:hypothetical protein